jgi:hypothetical protein
MANTLKGRGKGEGRWKYSGGGKLVQGTLHACMELLQSDPLVSLMCDK